MTTRWTCFALALAAACTASARVDYTMTVRDNQPIKLSMTFVATEGKTSLKLPNWAPGAYVLRTDNAKAVEGVSAKPSVDLSKGLENEWLLSTQPGKKYTVEYALPRRSPTGNLHITGPNTYLYINGRKEEDCRLTVDLAEGAKSTCGLPRISESAYSASSYDVLADNPITVGNYEVDTYTVQGVPNEIVYYAGPIADVDRAKVKEFCHRITAAQSDFWGGLPFDKYVWHFRVTPGNGGGGGLEHLSSTSITMAAGFGYGTQSVLSHELFHAWNVKRIRSEPLGPFDYDRLPITGALWWLEGVTDYYANLIMTRYGLGTPEELYTKAARTLGAVRSNPARLEVSPYNSSLQVYQAANWRGNSNGYKISYYQLGWLVGFALDTEIRARSGGKYSLDDVCLALWEQNKNDQPGFAEDEIRKQCIRFGGAGMADYFDRVVMKPGELPLEDALARVGLTLTTGSTAQSRSIMSVENPTSQQLAFRESWLFAGKKGWQP